METTITACHTTWGWIGIAASRAGLLGTTLPSMSREQALAPLLHRWPAARDGTSPFLAGLKEKLRRYFDGERVGFHDEPLDVHKATEFQARVWNVVRCIPRGEVRTYGWVADRAGSPLGARAVGRAMATNPFPIIVPCHRVVGQDGQLTGFGGGLDMKRRLLEFEGAIRPGSPFGD
jgi:methylated-DNA-[protein]-cysteine S-methyltransferase